MPSASRIFSGRVVELPHQPGNKLPGYQAGVSLRLFLVLAYDLDFAEDF